MVGEVRAGGGGPRGEDTEVVGEEGGEERTMLGRPGCKGWLRGGMGGGVVPGGGGRMFGWVVSA